VYVVYPHSVAETLTTIRNLGQITGEAASAEKLASSIEARIEKVRRQVSRFPKTATLGCVMLQPLTVAGPDTFVDDLIGIAGGLNIVPPGSSRYPTWNTEALLAINPEVIIVSSHPGQPDAELFFSHWKQLQAVQHKRIILIEADWVHRPGPRMILGIEALAKALHPGINIDE
ncbi:MAG: ABC transporter substrate-binding protein, partial [Proteobacteria bacterium]|nr:ABC transporter substrate-binding protein [Pseudomonadota bacterium]